MDLSKAFGTINYDLRLSKIHAYDFKKTVLILIKSYLTNRWQRTNINTCSLSELLQGAPHVSVLGPLSFFFFFFSFFFVYS